MTYCNGIKTDSRDKKSTPCRSPLYRCNKCGNVGCSQGGSLISCSQQGFKSGSCVKCKSGSGRTSA